MLVRTFPHSDNQTGVLIMDTYQTDNTVSEYRIEVDVIVTRVYVVSAKTPLEAMTAYRAGNAEVDESRSEMENWEEQADTARIVTA